MDLSKYDKIVWRINGSILLLLSLATLLICVVAGLYNLWWANNQSTRQIIVDIDDETKEKRFFRLGYFSHLDNTGSILIPLQVEGGESEKMALSSYQGQANRACNYLIYDKKGGKSQWVWKNNEQRIFKHTYVHSSTGKKEAVVGIVFESVPRDSNRNKILDRGDKKSLEYFGLSDSLKSLVIENIDMVLGVEQSSADELLIFFVVDSKSYVGTFNLLEKTLVSRVEIKIPG